MTISTRVIILVTCAISTLMVFGGFSLVKMDELSALTENLYKHPYTVGTSLRDFESQVLQINRHFVAICGEKNSANTLRYQKIQNYHQKNLASLQKVEMNFLGNREKVAEVKSAYLKWYNEVASVNDQGSKANVHYEHQANQLLDELYARSQYLKDFANQKASAFYQSASQTADFVLIISAVFLLAGFVFMGLVSIVVVRSLNAKLRNVAHHLSANTEVVSSEASDISQSSAGLSSTVSQQASSLHETAASVDELAAMVKNNVRQAEQSKNLSESMKVVSSQIENEMDELTRSMKDIVESNEKIEELVNVIDKIGDKTRVIDEIAFQTKILSLNASVEAERAGEHGRGFSVVAQEVSNLAQMSGQASKEISEIVKGSVGVAKDIASKNEKRVRRGEELASKTTVSIGEITKNLSEIFQSSEHILTASQDQSDGIDQVNQAMSELNDSTQQNSTLAEQSTAVAKKLEKQVSSLRKVSEEVSSLLGGHEVVSSDVLESVTHSGSEPDIVSEVDVIALKPTNGTASSVSELGKDSAEEKKGWEAI